MDGSFIRKKTNSWNVLLLLCGVFFVFLYIFLNIVDSEATGELLIFLIMGIICGSIAVPSMLLNRGAYIRVEENAVKAKYHWFGKLDCRIDDIEFVLPQINTLTILLKNGKRHTIMGVENSWALSASIRRQGFTIEKETPEFLRQKLSLAQAARKKELWWIVGGIALTFVYIFVAVLLTGGRDLNEFSRLDWIFFSAMGVLELLTLIILFYAAQRCGKRLLPIEQLRYRLRGAMIAAHPLPTDNIIAIYADENNSGRIVLCGFPNDNSVYYCVQKIYDNFELETVHTSGIYESTEELPEEEFSALIDITAHLSSNEKQPPT